MTDFFRVSNLTKNFGGVVAISDVSLVVREHEILGIIGPNGAGKSTLLNIVAGFYPQTAGTVELKGERLDGLQSFERAHRRIARTFQRPMVFPNLTAQQCVASAQIGKRMPAMREALFLRRHVASDKRQRMANAAAILTRVGLLERIDALASNLSHGDQMLLQLAVAVSNEPELLLLDEPASGLNPTELEKLRVVIQGFNEEGVTIMMVEHRMELVMSLCHRIVVLNKGEQIAEGTCTEIQNNPHVIEAYLGTRKTGCA
ncbi:MAG: ABC transporter ATP-binding protein [Actinobacteria bacterium]|nr:ABC transporter ATP-binding protein [Actinomycetota bacterium]